MNLSEVDIAMIAYNTFDMDSGIDMDEMKKFWDDSFSKVEA